MNAPATFPLMPFRYGCIYADPPWQMTMYSDKGMGRCPHGLVPGSRDNALVARHYETMTMAQLKALPVNHLAAPDCMLLMWAIDPMLPEAIELGRAWGFEYKTVGFYWAKTRRVSSNRPGNPDDPQRDFPIGTGYWTRANPEQCLLFTRGQPKRRSRAVRRLCVSPVRQHSRKPDEIHGRIEQLVDGPYVELFARQARPGWDCWGNDTDRFAQEGLAA